MADDSPAPQAPPPVQTLQLALHRQDQAWTAELAAQPGTPARQFASLRELVSYLTQLEQPLGRKGLR